MILFCNLPHTLTMNLEKRAEKKERIKNIISRNRDNFLYEMQEIRENKKYNVNPQITSQKGRTI